MFILYILWVQVRIRHQEHMWKRGAKKGAVDFNGLPFVSVRRVDLLTDGTKDLHSGVFCVVREPDREQHLLVA